MPTIVHSDPAEVVSRLTTLGLDGEELVTAVGRGQLAVNSCTLHHPKMYPPIAGWAETVYALREHCATLGYTNSDDNNYSICVSPDGRVAIAVATGNEATGLIAALPATRASKGPSTLEAVLINQANLELFPAEKKEAEVAAQRGHDDQRNTWILLIHRALNETRSELSLPVRIGNDGRVNDWRERIILRPIPRDPDPVGVTAPVQPDLDVKVVRRA